MLLKVGVALDHLVADFFDGAVDDDFGAAGAEFDFPGGDEDVVAWFGGVLEGGWYGVGLGEGGVLLAVFVWDVDCGGLEGDGEDLHRGRGHTRPRQL